MTDLRVLAIDDEPLARLRVRQALERIPGVSQVGEASGCADALEKVSALRPDILVLDICMRDGSGFDVIEQLPQDAAPCVVFVTAFDQFAVRAFETAAVDYVLKPISHARLEAAISRARERLAASQAAGELTDLRSVVSSLREKLREVARDTDAASFWIRCANGAMVRVPFSDIEWIEAEEDYVRLHVHGQSYLMRGSIRSATSHFKQGQFVRVHRRALVRRALIQAVAKAGDGKLEVVLASGARIAVGRVYGRQLRQGLKSNQGHEL